MTSRLETRRLALVVGALVLCTASRVQAHRLDEYVEQTLIELEPNRVVLHVDLSPGVAVAPDVLSAIDLDHDGVLSTAEQAAYAEQVRRDLSLSMNDAPMPLRLVESETRYPTVDSIKGGLGTIALTFEASSPSISSGTLRFVNHHAAAQASYLVNCLMPRSQEVRVLSQSRSREQASYQVELAVGTTTDRLSGLQTSTWVVVLLLAGGLLVFWREKKRSRPDGASSA